MRGTKHCLFGALMAAGLATAAHGAPATALRVRAEAYRPFDGSGRYTMDKDDGIRGIQGLATLAARRGAKPYKDLSTGEGQWLTWQSERVVFRDVDTFAPMMRLTADPFADQLSYFQGNWSADGKTIVWRRRPGMWESSTPTHGPMAMNADGTGLRNVFRDYGMVRNAVCSPTAPSLCYAVANSDTKVVAFDLASGKTHHVVRATTPRGWHMKISPDGHYLMNRADIAKGGKGLWIASVDGKELHEIPVPEAIHDSYHFHPTERKILFWYEGKFREEGFVQCGFDGEGKTNCLTQFDWNHGDFGLDRGVHCEGAVTRVKAEGWGPLEPLFHAPGVEYYDDPADYNGYSTWWPKDTLWTYHTRILRRPWMSEIFAAYAEPSPDSAVNRYRICYTALQRGRDLDGPNASPDGTKIVFNSNMHGHLGIYCVTARLPERPRDLALQSADGKARLTWQPPRHHAEIAGYHVYRGATGGTGFQPITSTPIAATTFDVAAGAYYAVTAVEHSGLESGLSDAVVVGKSGKRTLFVEAEDARLSPEMWIAYQGLASDLHYIWMRKKTGTGRAILPLGRAAPTGACTVWARVKSISGASFTIASGTSTTTLQAPASPAWSWVRAAIPIALRPDSTNIELTTSTYGSAIDCLVLTDDAESSPSSAPRVSWPALAPVNALHAEALSPYTARLSWDHAPGDTFHHFNLYCGDKSDFAPGQDTLVASPDKPGFVDWGLKSGATVYYRVTAVDRGGNETVPSPAMALRTPAIAAVAIEKPFAESVEFEAPIKDTYVVWFRLKKTEGARGGYLDVKIDNGGGGSWSAGLDGAADEEWFSYDKWGRFDLSAGKHTLTAKNKSGLAIDRVFVTNDQSQPPPGRVAILVGW